MTASTHATAEQLNAARRSHAAAVERHSQAMGRANNALEALAAVTAERRRLLDAAAAGAEVTETDLIRADTSAKSAKDVADLHLALASGAAKAAQELHIAVLGTEVSDHDARTAAASRAYTEAAQVVDAAVEEARLKLAAFHAAGDVLRRLGDEANHHNFATLPAALKGNPILAGRHPSEHPKMTPVTMSRNALEITIIRDAIMTPDMGERARRVHSLVPYAGGPTSAPASSATQAA